jgi:hypothetical protein
MSSAKAGLRDPLQACQGYISILLTESIYYILMFNDLNALRFSKYFCLQSKGSDFKMVS